MTSPISDEKLAALRLGVSKTTRFVHAEKETILSLLARLDKAEALGGGIRETPAPAWQPIETAPKDGSEIIFGYWEEWNDDDGQAYNVWSTYLVFWEDADQRWTEVGSNPCPLWCIQHWAPTPAPPEAPMPVRSDQPSPTAVRMRERRQRALDGWGPMVALDVTQRDIRALQKTGLLPETYERAEVGPALRQLMLRALVEYLAESRP